MKERLQKLISNAGLASRRAGEKLIEQGKVRVNGKIATLGDTADPDIDLIEVSGRRLRFDKKKTYIMLNKPRGYVTSLSDEKGRPCVKELVEDVGTRVYPIGRLDMNSEGLLLLTDDGDLANTLTHPSFEHNKTYRLTISGPCTLRSLELMRSPLDIDGYTIRPAKVSVIRSDDKTSILEVTIHEGRNRQIRKMCEIAELKLTRLVRISEAGLRLGDLPCGKWRHLDENELALLHK